MTAGLSSEQTSTDQHLCLDDFKTTNDDYLQRAAFCSKIKNNYLLSKDKNKRKTGVQFIHQLLESDLNNSYALFNTALELLGLIGEKKNEEVRILSDKASNLLFDGISNELIPIYITRYIIGSKNCALAPLSKWQTKVSALKILSKAAKKAPKEVESLMTVLVPVVSKLMWDVKKPVKEQAAETLEDICEAIDNIDLKPFIPRLVEAISDPDTVGDCIYALAGTTFVQTVNSAALSITVPLLKRGFSDSKTAIKRKCAVITENMAKLVKKAEDVEPFMPVLAPLLQLGMETIADPECRSRFEAANSVLTEVAAQKSNRMLLESGNFSDIIRNAINAENIDDIVKLIDEVCTKVININTSLNASVIESSISPIMQGAQPDTINLIADNIYKKCLEQNYINTENTNIESHVDEEDDSIPDICNLHFSLAYGSKILLNNSKLHLKKGFKYGIISEKSAGKTTMMRAISNGQVEGFPTSADGVRSIFIENDIQGSQLQMKVSEYLTDSIGFGIELSKEDAEKALIDGGFTQVMCDGLITQLSGGWKMKLALIRATLENADIMLMDEPTNHLDVLNVQWVVDYINSLPNVTCLIVSHDSAFLDKTVDHIIQFKTQKLNTYKGNVTAFVERFPDAKSYFELSSTKVQFKFPQPTLLDGVKTKGTAILSMNNCSFKYPSAEKNQLNNVTVKCSMASRVAIVGANGAGKSTMIKLLTGEMKPTVGTVSKHPNCRFAYVAQHAFHHIEQHLEKSPNEYIRWRYEGGQDKEARAKSTAIITDEEKKIMEKPFEISWKDEETGVMKKEKRTVEKLVARRKVKKEFHYEIKWKGKSMDFNSWFSREALAKRGFTKLMKLLDTKLASAQSYGKPLTSRNVEEHLGNVGLDSEAATHSRIKDLSGGQKVKVVLAACTWCCPHLIILDEPTNYLDRDSLGALANAIEEFEGGVVLITHNKEFADATTRVTWVVANNKCDIKGDPEWEKYAAEQEVIKAEAEAEMYDALGNKIDPKDNIKTVEEMSKQEVKKFKKQVKSKIKRGEPLEEYEMDWADEWNIKYEIPE